MLRNCQNLAVRYRTRRIFISQWTSAPPNSRYIQEPREHIESKLRTALKEAMKSKDSFNAQLIRSVLSDITYADKKESGGSSKKTTDRDGMIIQVIQSAIKRREASRDAYLATNPIRHDMTEHEESEIKALRQYIPPELSKDALESIIKGVIEEMGDTKQEGQRAIGAIIAKVKTSVNHQATGKAISETVKRLMTRH